MSERPSAPRPISIEERTFNPHLDRGVYRRRLTPDTSGFDEHEFVVLWEVDFTSTWGLHAWRWVEPGGKYVWGDDYVERVPPTRETLREFRATLKWGHKYRFEFYVVTSPRWQDNPNGTWGTLIRSITIDLTKPPPPAAPRP